jgi:GlpG protein
VRQIGTLPTQAQAERFTAYLITQGVSAQAEAEDEAWVIWVRDEDQLPRAKEAFDAFVENPDDPSYQGVVREANARLQSQAKRREEARKNYIAMRGRWQRRAVRKAPLVTVVIILCVIVFILSGFGGNPTSTPRRVLGFCDVVHALEDAGWTPDRLSDRLIDIRGGQLWRLVTPIFLHGSTLHLLFNMIMFHVFASRIEDRKGAWRLGLMILLIAIPSNLAQGLAPTTWGPMSGGPFFVGMSGVVYGLLGYLWMKTVYDPGDGLHIGYGTVGFLLIWMLLGFTGLLDGAFGGKIANLAHGVGLLAGMSLIYFRKSGR